MGGMPSSAAFRVPYPADRQDVRSEHRAALLVARNRAAPILAAILEMVRSGSDQKLDLALPGAMRELDLLWQAVGRVTQP